jgi:hypothetical protein
MTLDIVALFLIFFGVLTITLGIVMIHTYPGKVAKARNHPQVEAIEVTSLLGLLIFPLWMLALVWAYSGAVIGILYDPKRAGASGEMPAGAGPGEGEPEPGSGA